MIDDQFPLFFPDRPFIESYLRRAMKNVEPDGSVAVMISSQEIYEGANADEESAVLAESPWRQREERFIAEAKDLGVKPVILRAAHIVGTGMNGKPMLVARHVFRGTFFHFPGNTARISVIHAADLAEIAAEMLSASFSDKDPLIINVSDGAYPSIDELAEAFAFRMGNKRISTLSTRPQQIIGRFVYGKKLFKVFTADDCMDCSLMARTVNHRPAPVCEYLRTHTYDADSL